MVDDLTDFLTQQVGGEVVAEAVEGPVEGFAGRCEGFVMAACLLYTSDAADE